MSTATAQVPLDELRLLFTGDWIHDDQVWDTTPCYDVGLATLVAHRAGCDSEHDLQTVLYPDLPGDEIPPKARQAIRLAVERYRTIRKRLPR